LEQIVNRNPDKYFSMLANYYYDWKEHALTTTY